VRPKNKLGSNRDTEDFFREVARLFIPKSHLERTVHQVHDHVQLEVKRNGGHCDYRKVGGSRQEVKDKTGELCETEPEGRDSAMCCGTFTCTLLAPNIFLSTQF